MLTCLVLIAEPNAVFQGLHRTIDGAVHRAAALGATSFEDGSDLSIEGVASALEAVPSITLNCPPGEECRQIRIERHGINL